MSNKTKKAKTPAFNMNTVKIIVACYIAVLTFIICILPMGEFPIWNGEQPDHRNQYELMAESILDGRIDIPYGDDEELSKLENPYDPAQRSAAGVKYHWDHAYYDGHYYMYFGIVPVFLAFLPYRIVTGSALTTYHATQFFTVLIVIGFFALFWMLKERFFKKFPFALYLLLSSAFSVVSVWYAIAEPALYCTAIVAAIALEIWSIFFFIWAVFLEKQENKQILLATIGALLGALVFGCRPPIALANLVVIPLLVVFIKEHKFTKQLFGKLAIAASPYVFVAICLMIYNYARFDDPFEFGQAYQLTVADQTNLSVSLKGTKLLRVISETNANFFAFESIKETFPYQQASSVFFNFPILFLSIVAFFPPVKDKAKEAKIFPFIVTLIVGAAVITAADVLWSPYLLERYRMDIYFLMCIACFIVLGLWYETSKKKKWLIATIVIFSIITFVSCYLLYMQRVGVYYPDKLAEVAQKFDKIQ